MIPRHLGHIWIGPHAPPQDWMDTWVDAHPHWTYQLFDNAYLSGRRFRNQAQINEYYRRGKYAGVSDLMRYEILYEQGGFIAEADSTCLHPVDDLFTEDRAYTVYELPKGRFGMMSPFLASQPGNLVIAKVIETLSTLAPEAMENPWIATGNGFLRRFFSANPGLKADVTIFPSHYFIPEHYKGETYTGTDRIYSRQMWGTTLQAYPHSKGRSPQTPDQIAALRNDMLGRLDANLAAAPALPPLIPQPAARTIKVMFCGAHPDDAEIYVFGTLFAYRAAGAEVTLVLATNGGRGAAIRSPGRPVVLTRKIEAEASAAQLGAQLIALDLPDGGLTEARFDLSSSLTALFDRENPDLIITHSANDYHPDHRALSAAVSLAASDRFPVLFADNLKGNNFKPSHYVDITAFQEAKFACLRLHRSQMPRKYVLIAQELAKRRGREASRKDPKLVEAFRFDPHPKFDLTPLFPPPPPLPPTTAHAGDTAKGQVTATRPKGKT